MFPIVSDFLGTKCTKITCARPGGLETRTIIKERAIKPEGMPSRHVSSRPLSWLYSGPRDVSPARLRALFLDRALRWCAVLQVRLTCLAKVSATYAAIINIKSPSDLERKNVTLITYLITLTRTIRTLTHSYTTYIFLLCFVNPIRIAQRCYTR